MFDRMFASAFGVACAIASAQGAVVTTFTFEAGVASPDSVERGALVSDFGSFNGASGFVGTGHWNASNWDTSVFDARYTGFTITADAGKEVTLESISLKWWHDGASTSGASLRLIVSSPFGDQQFDYPNPSGISGGGEFFGRTDNFVDITLQEGQSVTFRWQMEGRSGSTLNIDDVVVNGTVVPTPGAIALFGIAGVVGLRRRR